MGIAGEGQLVVVEQELVELVEPLLYLPWVVQLEGEGRVWESLCVCVCVDREREREGEILFPSYR